MISHKQIELARTMLGMNQEQVGTVAGLTRSAISELEKGHTKTTTARLETLERYFVSRGIEFLDGNGLRMRQLPVVRYQGQEQFRLFMNDVYNIANSSGGYISLLNGDPAQLKHWLGEDWYAMHAARMAEIKEKFHFRVLVKQGEQLLIGKSFAEYRGFPADKFRDTMIYAYGDKVAYISFSDDVSVIVMQDASIADSTRYMFDTFWDSLSIPITDAG